VTYACNSTYRGDEDRVVKAQASLGRLLVKSPTQQKELGVVSITVIPATQEAQGVIVSSQPGEKARELT
jgi:hypothetical protein